MHFLHAYGVEVKNKSYLFIILCVILDKLQNSQLSQLLLASN